MRRIASFLVKAAVSVLLLYLSLRRVDLSSVGRKLGELDLGWIALVLAVLGSQVPINALRWRQIVAICDARLPMATALRYSFIGLFFSQVLPSTIGGDAARVWLLARGGAGWPISIYSVLIDRVVGVAALATIVVACTPWTFSIVHDAAPRAALVFIGFGALAAAAIFVGLGTTHIRVAEKWWLTRHLATAARLAWRLCRSVTGMRVAIMSLSIHLLTVLAAWGAAKAAHVPVEFAYVLFLFLPVLLVATVPISIAGWGVRESAMILAFSYAGLAEGDGLIVSILYGICCLVIGAIGGIVWVASGYRWNSIKIIEAETIAHDSSA
jgi:uncharacterized membrane protein YbhN (UPF0104 family)